MAKLKHFSLDSRCLGYHKRRAPYPNVKDHACTCVWGSSRKGGAPGGTLAALVPAGRATQSLGARGGGALKCCAREDVHVVTTLREGVEMPPRNILTS